MKKPKFRVMENESGRIYLQKTADGKRWYNCHEYSDEERALAAFERAIRQRDHSQVEHCVKRVIFSEEQL